MLDVTDMQRYGLLLRVRGLFRTNCEQIKSDTKERGFHDSIYVQFKANDNSGR